jgi:ComF family protein
MMFFKKFLEKTLDVLFPKRCIGCFNFVSNNSYFCKDCLSKIQIFDSFFCPKCKARIPGIKKICHQEEKFILGSATNYNEPVKQAIWRLKFKFITSGAEPLTNLLINYFKNLNLQELKIENFIVIPIPLSKKRLKERGFNQSELIAKLFAKHFNLKLETNILYRIKNAKPQSEINDFSLRKENVLNCFAVLNKNLIQNKNVILIDDVVTSGATFKEAVKTLKLAGAKKIIALAIARA